MFRKNPPSSIFGAALLCSSSSSKRIPISSLKPPQTGLPQELAPELSGTPNLQWLANLPRFTELLDNATKFPDANEFWQSPTHSALERVASAQPYFEILKTVSEHGFFFLIPKAVLARDAPLPHVAYEDIMRALLTCSMQRPPEEQFQLPPSVLRLLLCIAAQHILHDRAYFRTVEAWFRQNIERQQSLGSEAWSAWVMCCVAANKVDTAQLFLQHMEQNKIEFDPVVFNFMLHPSEVMTNEGGVPDSPLSRHVAKGFLLQQRLLKMMSVDDGTFATGVHAMFVYYAITRQPVQQWETIRVAIQKHRSRLSDRTVKLIAGVFKQEKGKRCGPLTVRALVQLFASRRDMFHTCLILANVRQREMSKIMKNNNVKGIEANASSMHLNDENSMMSMVPVMKFSQREEQFVLRCFSMKGDGNKENGNNNDDDNEGIEEVESPKNYETNSISKAREQYISKEHEKHFPLLKKLLSGDFKPFSKQEQAASLMMSSSTKSSSSHDGIRIEDEEDDDFVSNLLSLVSATSQDIAAKQTSSASSSALQVDGSEGMMNKQRNIDDDDSNKPRQKIVHERDFVNFVQQNSNAAFDPDFQTNSAMATFLVNEQKQNQRERFYEMKKATAWINPSEEK